MHQFERAQTRLRAALAAERFWQAALRLQRTLKRNPYWHLQPRVPAGNPDGGQWTESGPLGDEWTIGELVSGLPSAILKVLERYLAPVLHRESRRIVPYLRRLPNLWLNGESFPAEDQFDRETQRIAPPSLRRPGHAFIRFRSDHELRNFLGPAGPGREWHHIVEKRLAGRDGFPVEMIHATDNIISLPVEVHRRISARMSEKNPSFGSLTHRHWMERFSFGEQYNMGLDLIVETLMEMGYDIGQF